MGEPNQEISLCRCLELDHDGREDSRPSSPTAPESGPPHRLRNGSVAPARCLRSPGCGRPGAPCCVRASAPGHKDMACLQCLVTPCRVLSGRLGCCVEERDIFREMYAASGIQLPEPGSLRMLARAPVVAATPICQLGTAIQGPLHAQAPWMSSVRLKRNALSRRMAEGYPLKDRCSHTYTGLPGSGRGRRLPVGSGAAGMPLAGWCTIRRRQVGSCRYGWNSLSEVRVVNEQNAKRVGGSSRGFQGGR